MTYRVVASHPRTVGRLDASLCTTPRVAYDARLAIGHYRGMGRFLRQLIAGHEHDFLGLCAAGEQDQSLNLVASGSRAYPLWEQVSIPRLVGEQKLDVLLAPYNTAPLRLPSRVRLILVVHDLIFMDRQPMSRALYQNFGRWYRRWVVPRAVRRADMLVTVSHYSAEQLAARFALDSSRISVIPNTIDKEWFATEPAVPGIPPYILVVAGEAPSKNLRRTLAAFARLRLSSPDLDIHLRVAGVKPKFHAVFHAAARKLGVAEHVELLDYLSDSAMRQLYQRATLFVMPSLQEGFGIPVLEAMASGVPAVVSSATSLPEIADAAARYFDPSSVDEMAAAMRDVLADESLREQMVHQGRIQAQKYHPFVVRETIREFWEQVLN
jgi:glycosyltransferase involved in cell wall biosynthesis